MLGVERGEHYGFVVDAGGVAVDFCCGLGAEVAVVEVEVESADVVGAAGAGELHASLDARYGVVSFHNYSLVFSCWSDRHEGRGSEGNAGDCIREFLMWGMGAPHFARRTAEAAVPTRVLPAQAEGRFLHSAGPFALLRGRLRLIA